MAGSSPSPPLASVSYFALTATKEQSGPAHPGSHLQTFGPLQLPWPEQSFLHVACEQSVPENPAKQLHVPLLEKPFFEQISEMGLAQ